MKASHTVASLSACIVAAALCVPVAAQESAGQETRSGRVEITPYIEAAQVVAAQIEPFSDTVTYTTLAAGVDAGVSGRYSAGSVSLRYERRFGWSEDQLDGDTLSGIARSSLALVPNAVTFETGAMAARTRVDGNGGTSLGGFGGDDSSTSQLYSLYAGPSVRTHAGDLEVEGHYRLGYSRVEAPDVVVVTPGPGLANADYFDESTTHAGVLRAGFAPDTVLPIGVGVGGGWTEQDVSNLDQRIRDRHVRGDVTVPVSPTVAFVGGLGYEEVEISSRDALRDGSGNPVIGANGRYVTDKSAPRQIAYDTSGLIWDVGVLWRPSRRTSLEAHVGRRYGSETYYGTLSYAPNSRANLNVSLYDGVTGFGGALIDRLAGLPTEFDAFRNPISGDLAGCVAGLDGDNCAAGGLGAIRSAAFRSRGVTASYGYRMGRTQLAVGAGYDRRKYIAAAGTPLSAMDGVIDENIWFAASANTRLDERSSLAANGYVNWFETGFNPSGDAIGYSTSLAYNRNLWRGLTGTAAVGLDGITQEDLPDIMSASALLGLRYSF